MFGVAIIALSLVVTLVLLAIKPLRVFGVIGVIVTLIATALFSVTIVQARDVGVGVAFGKPTQVYENGMHFKAPWTSVEILDGAVQNDIYTNENAVNVRLGNNSKARAETSIQWRLKTDDAINIYRDYRTFDNIRSNLVDRNFRTALNEVIADYNPLSPEETASGGADLSDLSSQVEERMTEKIGKQVEVRAVNITLINFDEATQTRIDELQSEIARTRVAEQKQETSTAEAESNEILEESISPEVLTSKCLDIVEASGQSPIGCFPSGAGVQPITMVDDAPANTNQGENQGGN